VIHSTIVFCLLSGVASVTCNFVCVSVDAAYNIVYIPVIDSAIPEGIKQVVNVQRKMMFGNTFSMVDMTERPTRVSGRTVERGAEKFTLHSTEFINRGVFKKRLEFRICQDTIIKIMDKFGDCLLTANAFKKGLLFLGNCIHCKYLSDEYLFHYKIGAQQCLAG
jgi:hypothetical protein